MSLETRRLRVEFSTEAAFRSEYASNIANGGVFIASTEPLEVRDRVVVALHLGWCDRTLELEGEVVHCIPAEMVDAGGSPGAAIQFDLPAREIREQLEPLAGPIEGNERITRSGRRAASRTPARVRVLLRSRSHGEHEARTRDISSSGILASVAGAVLPVGESVEVEVAHPRSGECMTMKGTVVRQLATEAGEVRALGIEFHVPEARQTEVSAFINDVRAAEHSRRLGGISGPIAQLGIENLLQMFGSSSPQGTLLLTRGAEEGTIVFAGGKLLAARLGGLERKEALQQLLSWREGSFEFQTRIEDEDLLGQSGEEVPLSGAILEALCALDESGHAPSPEQRPSDRKRAKPAKAPRARSGARPALRVEVERAERRSPAKKAGAKPPPRPAEPVRILPGTVFVVDARQADATRGELGKIEEAVLDLAGVGMSVARMLEVIPEPELEVYAALDSLLERGLIRCR